MFSYAKNNDLTSGTAPPHCPPANPFLQGRDYKNKS